MATFESRTTANGESTWRVKIRKRGISATSTFTSKTDARKWATKTEAAILNGTYRATGNVPTLAEAVTRYTKEVVPTLSPGEQKTRPARMQFWVDRFGSRKLTDITPQEVSQVRDQQIKDGLKPATVNRSLAALASVYTAAIKRWHLMPRSAHILREVARIEENNARVRWLSDDERDRLLEATKASDNDYLHLAVVLSLATGWRQGEVMGLTWDRVDTKVGKLTLETSKNGDARSVRLAGYPLDLLREFRKVRRIGTDLLFPSKVDAGKPMLLRKPWLEALALAGIEDLHWHDMRHDVASRMVMSGASLPEVGAVLGHRSVQTAKRYAHLSDEHVSTALAVANSRVFGE
jgi:integrase